MATTQNLMNSVVFVQTLIKNQRMNVNGQEPALTMANMILQAILGPPFIWRQNRASLSVAITAAGGTDYVVSAPMMGRIEAQWLTDVNGKDMELTGAVCLAKVSGSKRPTKAALQYDDNAGNLTFRFNAVPDQNYTAHFDYQQKAGLITSWANPWGVVPDECGYIYNKGFLSLAALLVNDARFPIWDRQFVGSLLGAQDGLDQQAKDIFREQWMSESRSAVRSQGAVQAGVAGRSQ
ncbi:MAG: hypothetical protein WBQ94_04320 [Terracidiphilus sp.]